MNYCSEQDFKLDLRALACLTVRRLIQINDIASSQLAHPDLEWPAFRSEHLGEQLRFVLNSISVHCHRTLLLSLRRHRIGNTTKHQTSGIQRNWLIHTERLGQL